MNRQNPPDVLPVRPQKGSTVEFVVEKFADRGKALGRIDGYVIFVSGAAPGDRVRARMLKRRRHFGEARLLEILEEGPDRTQPRCSFFGTCGGCKWQHVTYTAQLEAKRASVEDALIRLGGFRDIEVPPTLGMEQPFFYRNKMEFSFGANRWLTSNEIGSEEPIDKSFALGLHIPGRYDKVLDVTECFLQSEYSARLVNSVRQFCKTVQWTPWDVRSHTGYLRHLSIRSPLHSSDFMVNLVTSSFDQDRMLHFATFLSEHFPEVTTLVNTIHSGTGQTAIGESAQVIFGSGKITDKIGPFRFEIGSSSFFQTNTRQAEVLYETALKFAELRPDDLVYDLYCGAGTISLFLAQHVRKVIGVELVPEAIENAWSNAALNDVQNVEFVSGDLLAVFSPEFVEQHGRPDVIVVDPPRAGIHPKVMKRIETLQPDRIVYVSCNPMTQARDLAMIGESYEITAIQPVDLFPQTHHIESVVGLKRRGIE